jgi:hypothetical protein
MAERVLMDNDVVLKAACYALGDEVLSATTLERVPPAMLGVGRFVIRSRLTRASNIADSGRATIAFERMIATMLLVEPDEDELAAAADLEAEAIHRDLELDGGESQLLAILAKRACSLLITGDKRAIAAMAVVATADVGSRIACLEQLIAHVATANDFPSVRTRICAEPKVDRAITSCFACSSPNTPDTADVLTGLASYASHLDRSAPGVLIRGNDLSSLTA